MAGGHAEGNDVGQGIEFAPEFAGGVGHAGDAAIKPVQDEGEADGFGGHLKIEHGLARVGGPDDRAVDGAHDGEIAKENIARRKERGQRIGRAGRRFAVRLLGI